MVSLHSSAIAPLAVASRANTDHSARGDVLATFSGDLFTPHTTPALRVPGRKLPKLPLAMTEDVYHSRYGGSTSRVPPELGAQEAPLGAAVTTVGRCDGGGSVARWRAAPAGHAFLGGGVLGRQVVRYFDPRRARKYVGSLAAMRTKLASTCQICASGRGAC
jgi:hypothetical protein